MSLLSNVLCTDRCYQTNGFVESFRNSHYQPAEWIGETTSNEYMPLIHAFQGMSELIRYEDQRALIYKLQCYLYNPIYGRRVRGVNRNPALILSQFAQGGRGYLLLGDIGVEVNLGLVIQRTNFATQSRDRETAKLLMVVGVKPEYVFSGNLNNPVVDTSQFILYVNNCMVSDPAYAAMYKKLYPLIVQVFIEHGIRTVFVKDIVPEIFRHRTYVPEFKSVGAMVDYKNALNDCIDMGEQMHVDYRDADAVREHPPLPTPEVVVPEVTAEPDEIFPDFDNLGDHDESTEPVSLPGVDGQPSQVTFTEGPLQIIGLDDEQDVIPF